MPRATEEFLRRQISESFVRSTERIDREVATALATGREYHRHFSSDEMRYVLANITHTLIDLQRFAGLTVPLTHNVAEIEVRISYPRLSASSLLHIHNPIRAFITLDYDLVNDPALPGALLLDRNSLRVSEKTGRLDLMAKAALKAIDIESMIHDELKDPAAVIRKTLPRRLGTYGFHGVIALVHLEITEDDRLHAVLLGQPDNGALPDDILPTSGPTE